MARTYFDWPSHLPEPIKIRRPRITAEIKQALLEYYADKPGCTIYIQDLLSGDNICSFSKARGMKARLRPNRYWSPRPLVNWDEARAAVKRLNDMGYKARLKFKHGGK